jgi:L-threonylcarbamoyladenylate synthase
MRTVVRRIPPGAEKLPAAMIREIAVLLNRGGVIAYPTETVYGIGGDPTRADVIERIHKLKMRSAEKTFLLLIGEGTDLNRYVDGVPDAAARLIKRFWPGPLTLIFRASSVFPPNLTGDRGTVALRLSPDPVCAALIREFGKPLISTSANPPGREPARSGDEVLKYFPKGIDAILDGGERRVLSSSTIVDVTRPVPILVRQGPIDAETIRSATGSLDAP